MTTCAIPAAALPMSLGHLRPIILPPEFYGSIEPPIVNVRLFGRLGRKFGHRWRLAVRTPREVVQAIESQRPGFRKEILKMKDFDFAVRLGHDYIGENRLDLCSAGKSISIRPIAHGSDTKGILQIIAGVVLIAVGVIFSATGFLSAASPFLISAGVGLILGGIAALIAGTPTVDNSANNKNKTSYQFGGAVNVAEQGAPCALPYGRVFAGSVVGSSSIKAQDIKAGSTDGMPPPNSDSVGTGGQPSNFGGGKDPPAVERPQYQSDPFDTREHRREAMGAGGQLIAAGAGGGSSSSGGFTEAPDTLASTQIAEILDVIGEGPIRGLVNGLQSIYLDDTPQENPDGGSIGGVNININSKAILSPTRTILKEHVDRLISGPGLQVGTKINTVTYNSDGSSTATISLAATGSTANATIAFSGSFNHSNFTIDFRNGTQDQTYIAGDESEAATAPVGVQIKKSGGPWIHDFSNPNLDAIRIELHIPKLEKQAKANGSITGSQVQITIELDSTGVGDSYVKVADDTINGKASTDYFRDYLIDIPQPPSGNWKVRVTRITDDSTSQLLSNETWINSYTEIVYGKLRHPNTVLARTTFDAQQFGQIPVRTFHIDGLLVQIPFNYDPDAHTYDGDWGGNFKTGWTCNPAWVLWDIITANRYGLGRFIPTSMLDKWAFYAAAQYCDELVPSGYRDSGGAQIMERRYECHAYIAGRKDAFGVLSDIGGIFQAAAAYINGVIVPVVDRFVDPELYAAQFNPTNVDDFNFTTVSKKAQRSAVLVDWNDPNDMGRPKSEYVDDQEVINAIGFNQDHVTAFGCYSRGQAHRRGAWLLALDKLRNEMVSYNTGLEGSTLLPGDVVDISTSFRSGKSLTGRVKAATLAQITLDRIVTLESGFSYGIQLYLQNGTMYDAIVANSAGNYSVLNLTLALPSPVVIESAFILIAGQLFPEPYRVLNVTLSDKLRAQVSAMAYYPGLYDAIDQGFDFDEIPPSGLPPVSFCMPPGKVTVVQRTVANPLGGFQIMIEASWVASADKFLDHYIVSWRVNQGNWTALQATSAQVVDIPAGDNGTYDVQVVAFNSVGAPSKPSLGTYYMKGGNPAAAMSVSGLELFAQGDGTIFQQRDAKFVWRLNSPTLVEDSLESSDGLQDGIDDPMFQRFQVQFFLDTTKIWGPIYTKEPIFIFTEEINTEGMRAAFLPSAKPTPTFRIEVRAQDIYNNLSTPAAALTVTNPPPAAPVGFLAFSSFKAAFLQWDNSSDVDLNGVQIFRNDTNSTVGAELLATLSVKAGDHSGYTDTKELESSLEYFYFLRSIDTFGNFSDFTAGKSVIIGSIEATDIADFTIDITQMFLNTIVLWGDVWLDNNNGTTSAPGYVSWNNHSVYWKGVKYNIAAGSTNLKYVYIRMAGKVAAPDPDPTPTYPNHYATSAGNPIDASLTPKWSNNSDFQIVVNIAGVHELAWYAFANAVIGSAYIADAAITSAKIALLAVDDAHITNAGISKLAVQSVFAENIVAGEVSADKFTSGLGDSLALNPSFEQLDASNVPLSWTLNNGAATTFGVPAADGLYCVQGALGIQLSGATTTIPFPVKAGSTYYMHVAVRASDIANQKLRIGFAQWSHWEPAPGTQTRSAQNYKWMVLDTVINQIALPPQTPPLTWATGTWFTLPFQVKFDADCLFAQIILSGNSGTPPISGARVSFDAVFLSATNPDESLVSIDGGKIKVGAIQSNDFNSGSAGWQADTAGVIEATGAIFRNFVLFQNNVAPTFTEDYSHTALASRTFTDNDQISVRAHALGTTFRMRYELNASVLSDSQFWPWYQSNHKTVASVTSAAGSAVITFPTGAVLAVDVNSTITHPGFSGSGPYHIGLINSPTSATIYNAGGAVNASTGTTGTLTFPNGRLGSNASGVTIAGREGVGPDDFAGFVLSDGAGGFPTYQKAVAFHACVVAGANNDILSQEQIVTLTWTPPDVNATPVLAPPFIYTLASDSNPARGTAGYIIRCDHTDAAATVMKSTDGVNFVAYTKTAAVTLAVGANIYFKASEAGYKDSPVAFFSNTGSGLPTQGGSGGTTRAAEAATIEKKAMQIQTGTASVAVENLAIVHSSIGNDWSRAEAGDMFGVDNNWYWLASDAVISSGAGPTAVWQIQLTAPFAGATGTPLVYSIHTDFEPVFGLPLFAGGDTQIASLLNRIHVMLAQKLQAIGGLVSNAMFATDTDFVWEQSGDTFPMMASAVIQSTALTAERNGTLPPAGNYYPGTILQFIDYETSNDLPFGRTWSAQAGDTLQGGTSTIKAFAGNGTARFVSDGAIGWTLLDQHSSIQYFEDAADPSKRLRLDLSAISPNTTRIGTSPNSDFTMGGSGGAPGDWQPHTTNLDGWSLKSPFAGTLAITAAKAVAITGSLTIGGTDGATLNVLGGGGNIPVGSAAYIAANAFAMANRGMPSGGGGGSMLIKNSATDYDVIWSAASLALSPSTNQFLATPLTGGTVSYQPSFSFSSRATTGLGPADGYGVGLGLYAAANLALAVYNWGAVILGTGAGLAFSSNATDASAPLSIDLGITRNAAGVLEINNSGRGAFRDLKLRNLIASGAITGNGSVPALGASGYILAKNSAADYDLVWIPAPTGGSGTGSPAGSNTQVQFNDSGAMGGAIELLYNKATKQLSVTPGTFAAPGLTFFRHNSGIYHGNGGIGDFVGVAVNNVVNLVVTALPGYGVIIPNVLQFQAGWDGGGSGPDVALQKSASGILEVNNGTAGQFRDLYARNIVLQSSGKITGNGTVPAGGAGGQVLVKNSGSDYDVAWAAGPAAANGIPTGGTTNQILAKNSATNYDAGWVPKPLAFPSGGISGQVLVKNSSTDGDATWQSRPAPVVRFFNTAGGGSYTTTYAGCRAIFVELIGGGGGSAGALGTATPSSAASGGGGGGSYACKFILSPITPISYVIGAGGAAGNATPTAGGNGGDSTFGTTSPLTGLGGIGSAIPGAGTSSAQSGGGGPPGSGSLAASNGDMYISGAPGLPGLRYNNAGAPVAYGGYGGGSFWCPSVWANGFNANGISAAGWGAGGGGSGAASSGATGRAGATGADGAMRITEYY